MAWYRVPADRARARVRARVRAIGLGLRCAQWAGVAVGEQVEIELVGRRLAHLGQGQG